MPVYGLRFPAPILVLVLFGLQLPTRAQTTPNQINPGNATGIQAYNAYGGVRENINLANGNLNLQIPLLSLPGRSGHHLTIALEYDSKVWNLLHFADEFSSWYTWDYEERRQAIGTLGWRLGIPVLQSTVRTMTPTSNIECQMDFIATLSDGSKHTFTNRAACQKTVSGQVVQEPQYNIPVSDSNGASYLRLDTSNQSSVVLHMKDGTRVYFTGQFPDPFYSRIPDKIVDGDGNAITIQNNSGVQVVGTTDTVGRSVSFSYSPTTISYKDSNGTTQSITLGFTNVSTAATFVLPSFSGGWSGTASQLSTITLPNGLTYTFEYNSFGELTKIKYPTGGHTKYDYARFTHWWEMWMDSGATAADFREITARRVCRNSSGVCGTEDVTTYTPTVDGTKTNNQYMDVRDPEGNRTRHQFSYMPNATMSKFFSPRELARWVYQGESTLLRTIQTDYNGLDAQGRPTNGSLPIRVRTTLNDTNQVTKVEWDYGTYTAASGGQSAIDNVTEQREYDYGAGIPGGLARKTVNTWLKVNPINGQDYQTTAMYILDRKATEAIYDAVGSLKAQTQFEYDCYQPTCGAEAALSANGAVQHEASYGTSYTTRGNLTATKRWRNTDGAWLETRHLLYDDAGNVLKTRDSGGHATNLSYADSWTNASCPPTGGSAKAYVTTTTNALSQTTTATYNSCSGTIASTTDPNTRTISFTYDSMGRQIQANFPDTGQATRTFNETTLPLSVTPSIKITSTLNLVPPITVDGLGRVTQSRLNSDPEGVTYADTTYDELGRKKTVSNPYRSTSDPTYGITTFNYDALGRATQVIPPDGTGTTNNVSTTYSGNCSTVTDQAGKKRKACTDALGRLIQVFEPNAASSLVIETDYQYDVLNNLLCVHQRGTDTTPDKPCTDPTVPATWRPRKFTYNSLSQLLTATNPESGTITYTYDADGNVQTKTDARSITTTYSYDVLHRLTQKSYSDATPVVKYGYDGVAPSGCTPPTLTITNGVGRRTAMCDAAGAEAWSYDSMGRVLTDSRTTNAVTKTTSYTYNLDGSLATVTYPSGRVITYTPNAAGRLVSAVDVANSINYATAALYAAPGALSSFQNGTGIVSTMYYNNRLQPCRISVKSSGTAPGSCTDTANIGNVLDFTYGFNAGTANNGNVISIANNLNTARTQSFTYDEMNRVKTALTQGTTGSLCWGLDYSYDVYANLTTVALDPARPSCTWTTLNAGISTSNRITNTGFSYDAAGNVLSDGSFSYTWNAESQLKTAAGVTYTYDGDGRRVQKSNGKLYWYGAGGEVIAESDAAGNFTDEHVFFGGKRIARRNVGSGNVYYYFADHLGSSRVVLQSGQSTPCYDADFDPFGGEHIVANTCPQNYKFTGKERDTETNLDNFEARYYSSQFGRFHSADWSAIPVPVPYADLGNPQTLNLYAYVTNNPLNLTDPTGHSITTTPGPTCSCAGAHEVVPALHVESAGGDFGPGEDHVLEAAIAASAVNNELAIAELMGQQQAQTQVPTSLSVLQVTVLPTGIKGDFGNPPSKNYGIMVDIKYQVLDSDGKPIRNAQMTPKEDVTFGDGTKQSNNIGPTRISTTSKTTAPDGTFHDAPVGHASPLPIAKPVKLQQTIKIELGGKLYTVRSQVFWITAPRGAAGFGHGTIENTLGDIWATR